MRCLVLLLCLVFVSCGDDADDVFCADGLFEHYEQTGDDAYNRWCEDPVDPGVRHGHFLRWHPHIGVKDEGLYYRGEKCGAWRECYPKTSDRAWDCRIAEHTPCPDF